MESFQSPEFFLWLVPSFLGVLLFGFLGLRFARWPLKFALIGLRALALFLILFALAGPFETHTPELRGVIVLGHGLPSGMKKSLKQRASDTSLIVEEQKTGVFIAETGQKLAMNMESFLHKLRNQASQVRSFQAYLPYEEINKALQQLEVNPSFPYQLHPVEERSFQAEERSIPEPRKGIGTLQLFAPVSVIPDEPFRITFLSSFLPSTTYYHLVLEEQNLSFKEEQRGVFLSEEIVLSHKENPEGEQDPKDYELRLEARASDKSLIVETRRSIRLQAQPERIFVISSDNHQVEVWNALLPGFDVYGLDPESEDKQEILGFARALILPLDQPRLPSAQTLRLIQAYVQAGGSLFITGLRYQDLEERPLSQELLALLPVDFKPPPPKPEDKEEPKVEPEIEKRLAELAKVSVVFAIDHSGSMAFQNRWNHCLKAVEVAFNRIEQYDRTGVLLFRDTPQFIGGEGITENLAGRVERLKQYLQEHGPYTDQSPHTDIYAAAKKGIDALQDDPAAIKLLILVSDGEERQGQGRVPEIDHARLAGEALASNITIVTIRVGAGEGAGLDNHRPDRVMKELSTDPSKAYGVRDQEGKVEIPDLVLLSVNFAYQQYQELLTENQDSKDPPQEEEKQPEPEQKETQELIAGSLPLSLTPLGKLLFEGYALKQEEELFGEMPALGRGLTEVTSRPESRVLARVHHSKEEGAESSPALVTSAHASSGGSIFYFAAPLNGRSAGSWLQRLPETSGFFDHLIRYGSNTSLSGQSEIFGLEVSPGQLSFRTLSEDPELELVGISEDGKRYSLAFKKIGEHVVVLLPQLIEEVEIRKEGETLLSVSVLPILLEPVVGTPVHPKKLSGGPDPESHFQKQDKQVLQKSQLATVFLIFLLCILPVDRYLRRKLDG